MKPRKIQLAKSVQRDLERVDGQRVVVATVLTITTDMVDRYEQAGLLADCGTITAAAPAPPPPTCGIWALRNLDGWQEKRKDLPKEMRVVSSWAPSWNGGGYHLIHRTIEAWPLDHHPARMLTISAKVLEPLQDGAIVRFRVDQPLDRSAPDFAENLKFNLRLLREVVGQSHIYGADMSDEDFANLQHVDWELIPTGAADRVLARLASGRTATEEQIAVASDRIKVLDRLNHDGFIVGRGRFARYFGAKFGEKLLVLENLEYGNALYVVPRQRLWHRLGVEV